MSERPKRRRFTAEYKLRIVLEADACKGDGDIVALLGREGLYSSQLSAWRRQRDEIAKAGLALRKRGRKAKAEDPKLKELEREKCAPEASSRSGGNDARDPKKASELLGIPDWPKFAGPITRSVFANRGRIFKSSTDFNLFEGSRSIGRRMSMLEHLDIFNSPRST